MVNTVCRNELRWCYSHKMMMGTARTSGVAKH